MKKPTADANALEGRTVVAVRQLRESEMLNIDRPDLITVIEFDDGTLLIGGQDEQFFGLGWLYTRNPQSKEWELIEPSTEAV